MLTLLLGYVYTLHMYYRDFSIETAVEFGRLYRRNGLWKFEAMGNGFKGGLEAMVNKYVY